MKATMWLMGAALAVAPFAAQAVPVAETFVIGGDAAGSREVGPFPEVGYDSVAYAFEAVEDVNLAIDFAVVGVGTSARALEAVSWGVGYDLDEIDTDKSFDFEDDDDAVGGADTDAGQLLLFGGETGYLLFDILDGFTFGDKEIANLKFSFVAEKLPTSPGEPGVIPLPAPAFLLLSGLAGLAVMRRKRA